MAEDLTEEDIDLIRKLMRARQGLNIDDDAFQGLMNIKDLKERTKLGLHNIYRHAYLYLLADSGGEEWQICKEWAKLEETFFISQDGERANAFIATLAKKQEQQPSMTMVTVPPQQAPEQEKKKGWFRR